MNDIDLLTVNRSMKRLTTANCGAVENHKTELQNPKLQKTEVKKGQNCKTVNPNLPLVVNLLKFCKFYV